MKTIVEINNNNYGSTGNIMINIAKEARKEGYKVYTACKNSRQAKRFSFPDQIYIGTWLDRVISERLAYYTGFKDHFNVLNTKSFLKQLDSIKPDLIHLHNIHDTYLNHKMLFNYIKKNNIPVVWTFHDCWPITGQCIHFEMVKCYKWKTGCSNCPQMRKYPDTRIDKTSILWKEKKEYFNNINNLTIVTPSNWLSNLVRESYLKDYPIQVINNGIDLDKFKPLDSSFRKKYHLEDKIIILGVAYNWTLRKGIDVFIELSKRLSNKYQIVLVGTNDEVDKILPNNIISIHKTYNQEELIKIYSACDIFVNPTREDNFPTVNIEALACGLPVITFNTGGAGEMLNNKCGKVIEKNNIDELVKQIKSSSFNRNDCINQSKMFNSNSKFNDYINLFNII